MKEAIRSLVLSLGADVCGFAAIDRFEAAPKGYSPADLFPACRSVVVFGVALPAALLTVDSRYLYGHYNDVCIGQVDNIALTAAKALERDFGTAAAPVPCDGPYDSWDQQKLEGRGLISMKHAAVLAGIGSLGKSTMLINSRFGNRLTVGAILTDATLASDEPAASLCPPSCRRCLEACPTGALDGTTAEQARCRPHAYAKNARGFSIVACNACRTACPLRFGADR